VGVEVAVEVGFQVVSSDDDEVYVYVFVCVYVYVYVYVPDWQKVWQV
jgi:hypothetical protein